MATVRENIQIIDKLIELTQHQDISWQRKSAPTQLIGINNTVESVYLTEHKGKSIRLYEQMGKHNIEGIESIWQGRTVLEFVDEQGHSIWSFPDSRNIKDLLSAVKYKDAGVEHFFKEMLRG